MEHDVVDGVEFTEFKEMKHASGSKRFLKFYLVGRDGTEHLAAVGEDLGDAHYHYKTTKPFNKYGVIDGHQRKDLLLWLEQVIKESSGGSQEAAVVEPTPDNPQGLYFTGHRHVRDYYEDGRRCNKWYLMDQHGIEHLAVVGEERDTRDGHYTYRAEDPFAQMHPLNCSNQAGVFHWLEQMITHHATAAGIPPETILSKIVHVAAPRGGGAGSARREDGEERHRPNQLLILEPGSSRRAARAAAEKEGYLGSSGGRGRGRGRKSGVKHKQHTGIVEQMQLKRMRKMQEEAETEQAVLQAAHIAKLRRGAVAEASRRESARNATFTWLKATPTGDELQMLHHWRDVLRGLHPQWQSKQHTKGPSPNKRHHGRSSSSSSQAAADAGGVAIAGQDAQQQQQQQQRHAVRVLLEALKELGALFVPLGALLASEAIDTVRAFTAHPHPEVASAAHRVLSHWLLQLASHVAVLDMAEYTQDPVSELEVKLAQGQVKLPTLPPKVVSTPGLKGAQPSPGKTPAAAALSTPHPSRGGVATPGPAGAAALLAEAGAFLAPMANTGTDTHLLLSTSQGLTDTGTGSHLLLSTSQVMPTANANAHTPLLLSTQNQDMHTAGLSLLGAGSQGLPFSRIDAAAGPSSNTGAGSNVLQNTMPGASFANSGAAGAGAGSAAAALLAVNRQQPGAMSFGLDPGVASVLLANAATPTVAAGPTAAMASAAAGMLAAHTSGPATAAMALAAGAPGWHTASGMAGPSSTPMMVGLGHGINLSGPGGFGSPLPQPVPSPMPPQVPGNSTLHTPGTASSAGNGTASGGDAMQQL